MFNNFCKFFGVNKEFSILKTPYDTFIRAFSGKQFGNGMFNVFWEKDMQQWRDNVCMAYPMIEGEIEVFGYDWLGNCFGICKNENEDEQVYLYEIGTGEILIVANSFEEFINEEIPNNTQACLAEKFYEEWLDSSGIEVKYDKCIGYKIPLFMGGEDNINNLEENDLDVYWGVLSQIMRTMRGIV